MGQLIFVWQCSQGLCHTSLVPSSPVADMGMVRSKAWGSCSRGWSGTISHRRDRDSIGNVCCSQDITLMFSFIPLRKETPFSWIPSISLLWFNLEIQSYPQWMAGESPSERLPPWTWCSMTSSPTHFHLQCKASLLTSSSPSAAVGLSLWSLRGDPAGLSELWGPWGGSQAICLPWRGCRMQWTEPKPSLWLFSFLWDQQLFLGWLPFLRHFCPLSAPTQPTKPGPWPPDTFTLWLPIWMLTTANKATAGEKAENLRFYTPMGLWRPSGPLL